MEPHPILPPFFLLFGPDTSKGIRSPCFCQALYPGQSTPQLSVTVYDKSADLCQSAWADSVWKLISLRDEQKEWQRKIFLLLTKVCLMTSANVINVRAHTCMYVK